MENIFQHNGDYYMINLKDISKGTANDCQSSKIEVIKCGVSKDQDKPAQMKSSEPNVSVQKCELDKLLKNLKITKNDKTLDFTTKVSDLRSIVYR